MVLIVAVNADWGIGFEGKQQIVLPEDRLFFKKTTSGGVIIAGRTTFEEFPGALPDRKNIVLTRDRNFRAKDVTVLHSIEEVIGEVRNEDPNKTFVVGGGTVYNQFLPFCDKAYVTKLETTPKSDTYFTRLDELDNWSREREIESGESNGVRYTINVYRKDEQIGGIFIPSTHE